MTQPAGWCTNNKSVVKFLHGNTVLQGDKTLMYKRPTSRHSMPTRFPLLGDPSVSFLNEWKQHSTNIKTISKYLTTQCQLRCHPPGYKHLRNQDPMDRPLNLYLNPGFRWQLYRIKHPFWILCLLQMKKNQQPVIQSCCKCDNRYFSVFWQQEPTNYSVLMAIICAGNVHWFSEEKKF